MAQLTFNNQQDYEDWVKKNPGVTHDIMGNNGTVAKSVQGDQGLVGNVVNGLLNPLTQFGTGIGEQLNAMGKQDYKPQNMSQEEWDQYVKNPLGKNLRNIAGVAADVVPFIPGVGAIAGGALNGILGTIGSGDATQNIDAGDVIKNGVIGGVTGGVTDFALGKASDLLGGGAKNAAEAAAPDIAKAAPDFSAPSTLNPVEKFGRDLKYSAGMGIEPKPGLEFMGTADKIHSMTDNALNYYGLDRSFEGLNELPAKLRNTQQQILDNSKFYTQGNDIIQKATENLLNVKPELTPDAAQALIEKNVVSFNRSRFPDVFKGLSPEDSINGRFVMDADAINKLKQTMYGAKGDVSNAIYDAAKNTLQDNVPGLKDVNTMFANLFEQNPNIVGAWESGGKVSNFGKYALLNKVQRGLVAKAGDVIGTIGHMLPGGQGLGALASETGPLAGVAGIVGGKTANSVTGGAQQNVQQNNQLADAISKNGVQGLDQAANIARIAGAGGQNPDAILKAHGLPTTDKIQPLQAANTAIQTVAKQVAQNQGEFGRGNQIPGVTNVRDLVNPNRQGLLFPAVAAIVPLVSAASGLSAADLANITPTVNDDPTTVLTKLGQLQALLNARSGTSNYQPATATAGLTAGTTGTGLNLANGLGI